MDMDGEGALGEGGRVITRSQRTVFGLMGAKD